MSNVLYVYIYSFSPLYQAVIREKNNIESKDKVIQKQKMQFSLKESSNCMCKLLDRY